MLSASGRFAVPEKILKRSSFTALALHQLLGLQTSRPKFAFNNQLFGSWRRRGSTEDKRRTQIGFNECPAFYERTCRARVSRKQRSDRPETQQRLGAPALGSGKLQTPPNRYPPARLLQLLVEARPA